MKTDTDFKNELLSKVHDLNVTIRLAHTQGLTVEVAPTRITSVGESDCQVLGVQVSRITKV